ncbi:MAG: hypothetical protein IJL77_03195, partial [Clostridia bacterium]|nr:hypothetical protein [Clostridia bacterium]
ESYVADMFAARREAKEAYEALTDTQKSQISAELVAKLNDELPTKYNLTSLKISPEDMTNIAMKLFSRAISSMN